MPFSASTCLSYTGTTTLTDPIRIFSNLNDIVPFTSVTLNQITSCPLVLTGIPDGTTTIKIKSANNYCCDIELTCNDLCTTCDLAFDVYSTNLISRLVAGNLTGSCDNNITQYRINWYRDSETTPIFTSGFGSDFTPYNYTHPLTGATSPLVYSGLYTPVVDRVKINGLNYSYTGGSGFIQANLDCFNTSQIDVEAFDCSNGSGTSNLPQYTHRVQFSGASAGITPLPLTATFNLDPTTDYFAWKFKGFDVPDSLKISFNSSSYPNPIILEYWVIGNDVFNNISLTNLPKSALTSVFLPKVTSLTALTRNFDDYLTLEVTPNQNTSQTNWDFYFTCLDNFNCSLCTDNYLNTPYKIQKSTVSVGSPDACGKRNITYFISGCTVNELENSDIGKYMDVFLNNNLLTGTEYIATSNSTSLSQRTEAYFTGDTSCGAAGQIFAKNCNLPTNTNTIQFEKTIVAGVGVINMIFSDLSDLVAYKSSYDTRKVGWVNDPNDWNYYKYVTLGIPKTTGNQLCGDNVGTLDYKIHYSSVMTTGGTAGSYTLTMPMPTITNSLPNYGPCAVGCNTAAPIIVTAVNTASTGTTNNTGFTTNTGSRYISPFYATNYAYYSVLTGKYSGDTRAGRTIINNSLNSTVPFSGNNSPYVQIPSLSSQTCNFSSVGELVFSGTQSQAKNIYAHDYKLVILNPPDLTAFSIKANTIVNGIRTSTGYPVTALTYSGGTVTYFDPAYTF